jgi:2-iminobutanoate/2-iminopropanoate deaminase
VKAISTPKAPAAIGPYSQAVQSGNLLFVSGQLGIDPQSGNMAEGFEAQTKLVFSHLQAILEEAGMNFANVVKASVFLKDMNDFALLNDIYAGYFEAPFPAREAIQVARLPKDGLVEISIMAVKS